MMVIGLTGGIASGKSTVAAMLTKAGIPVIDADALAREATAKNSKTLEEIVKHFGTSILEKDGSLNRKKLADIVFNDEASLRMLESIVHKKIEELRILHLDKLKAEGCPVAVYMAPLLFETNSHKSVDKTLLIIADETLRKQRVKTRDKSKEKDIKNRMKFQLNDDLKKAIATEIINNNGTVDELYQKLTIVWPRLTGMDLPKKLSV